MGKRILFNQCLSVSAPTSEGIKYYKEHVGCYHDSLPRVFPNYYSNLGVEECYRKAVELDYETFAIQYGGECWLDDSGIKMTIKNTESPISARMGKGENGSIVSTESSVSNIYGKFYRETIPLTNIEHQNRMIERS